MPALRVGTRECTVRSVRLLQEGRNHGLWSSEYAQLAAALALAGWSASPTVSLSGCRYRPVSTPTVEHATSWRNSSNMIIGLRSTTEAPQHEKSVEKRDELESGVKQVRLLCIASLRFFHQSQAAHSLSRACMTPIVASTGRRWKRTLRVHCLICHVSHVDSVVHTFITRGTVDWV